AAASVKRERFQPHSPAFRSALPLAAPAPCQSFHPPRLGNGQGAIRRDQLREPPIHSAPGRPIIFDPGRCVGEDQASPLAETSAGGSSIARTPRIASASSRLIGWPARCRSARSTAPVLVCTPYRSMIALTNVSSISIFVRTLAIHQSYT